MRRGQRSSAISITTRSATSRAGCAGSSNFAAAAGSMLLAHAAGPSMDVKTGLWEITSTGATTGAPPIPPEALAQMTPEQRAKMESAMRAEIARNNQSHVSKSCITQRQLEKAPDFAE